jgi:hypothetical protein
MSASTFRIPDAGYEALICGDLSSLQFMILVLLYRRANWKTGVVRAISADQVIRDLGETGLIPSAVSFDARKQIVQRAMKAMRLAGWFTSDYKAGSRRPYYITLTNYLSLYTAQTAKPEPDADSDADGIILNPSDITPCKQPAPEIDADTDADSDTDVTLRRRGRDAEMTLNNHIRTNQEKETPLPPKGVPPLPSPSGKRSNAAGLFQSAKANPADREKLLRDVAVLYVAFSVWLYGFSPDASHVEALLQDFHPAEILYAQVRRFKPWTGEKFKTTEMAQFFRKAGRDSIEAARLQAPAVPEWFQGNDFTHRDYAVKENIKSLREHWSPVIAAWNKLHGRVEVAAERIVEVKS